MITLNVKNYCHNCPEFEPYADKNTLYSGDEKMHMTEIRCIHSERCKIIAEFLELEKGEINND